MLVLIDVDGTLLGGLHSEPAFILHLARRGILGPRQYAAALWFTLRWWPRYKEHVFKKNKAYLTGLDLSRVEELAACFVHDTVLRHVRPCMRKRLEAHQAAGDHLALLTGTPDFIARPLAEALQIPHWSAAEPTHNGSRFLLQPPLQHPFGAAKIELGMALAQRLGFGLQQCAAYGDSIHDLPLLEHVARPVAVCPDRKLALTAAERGWEILCD